MNQQTRPPSSKRLVSLTLTAIALAALIAVTIVLPWEYGIDPTGAGAAMGLTDRGQPARSVRIVDAVGGNETYRDVPIPDFGEPVPLPNPAVFQEQSAPARTETRTVKLEPNQGTEIKALLRGAQVILFEWRVTGGEAYSDFHGHDPAASKEFWVRYHEHQSTTSGASGSLVAPFDGEHGWYWKNVGETPIEIELRVQGFYQEIVDHGLL